MLYSYNMKLLAEITEASLGLSDKREVLGARYDLRKSARAILVNEQGLIAVQYLHNYTFHKLPGGGMEPSETPEDAVRREVREEIGCDCEILWPIGMTIEYRNDLLHISYAYAAKVVGALGAPALEDIEIEEGQETLWLPPKIVLEKMQTDTPGKFEGHFILKREMTFIEEFLRRTNR